MMFIKNNESLTSTCVSKDCLKNSKVTKDYCYNNASLPLCAASQSGYTYNQIKNTCVNSNKEELPPCDKSFMLDHTQIARTMCPLCLLYEVNN